MEIYSSVIGCCSYVQEVPEGQNPEDVVGRPVAHLSALKQATGEAVYCDDMPRYTGKCVCMCVCVCVCVHACVFMCVRCMCMCTCNMHTCMCQGVEGKKRDDLLYCIW